MPGRIKLELRRLDIPSKIKKAENIVKCMSNNEYFPAPDPQLSEIIKAAKQLEKKYKEVHLARKTARKKTLEMNNAENELDKKLTHLATYVENKAKGDSEKIRSAGMDVRSGYTPVGLPDKTEIISVTPSNLSGELILKWKKVRGAKSYNIEVCENHNNQEWKVNDITTKTKSVIHNLVSGTKYSFRVQAIGSAGKGPYSDPVGKFAQ